MPLFGQHRLHDAARRGDANAVSRYILKHDDINAVDNGTGDTALIAAVRAANVGCVTRLLYAQGINVNAASSRDGLTALDVALRSNSTTALTIVQKLVRALLNHHQLDINQTTAPNDTNGTRRRRFVFSALQLRIGWSPLMYAIHVDYVTNRSTAFVSILLERSDCDVNYANPYSNPCGETALMLAVHLGDIECIRELLRCRGAQLNIRAINATNRTALDVARYYNRQDIVDLLQQQLMLNTNGAVAHVHFAQPTHVDLPESNQTDEHATNPRAARSAGPIFAEIPRMLLTEHNVTVRTRNSVGNVPIDPDYDVLLASTLEDEKDDSDSVPGMPSTPIVSSFCCVCQYRVSTHACIPCGHRCLCRKCSVLLAKDAKYTDGRKSIPCPICRNEALLICRIYDL